MSEPAWAVTPGTWMISIVAMSSEETRRCPRPESAMSETPPHKSARPEQPQPSQWHIWSRYRLIGGSEETKAARPVLVRAAVARPLRPPLQRYPTASGFADPGLWRDATAQRSHETWAAPTKLCYPVRSPRLLRDPPDRFVRQADAVHSKADCRDRGLALDHSCQLPLLLSLLGGSGNAEDTGPASPYATRISIMLV